MKHWLSFEPQKVVPSRYQDKYGIWGMKEIYGKTIFVPIGDIIIPISLEQDKHHYHIFFFLWKAQVLLWSYFPNTAYEDIVKTYVDAPTYLHYMK